MWLLPHTLCSPPCSNNWSQSWDLNELVGPTPFSENLPPWIYTTSTHFISSLTCFLHVCHVHFFDDLSFLKAKKAHLKPPLQGTSNRLCPGRNHTANGAKTELQTRTEEPLQVQRRTHWKSLKKTQSRTAKEGDDMGDKDSLPRCNIAHTIGADSPPLFWDWVLGHPVWSVLNRWTTMLLLVSKSEKTFQGNRRSSNDGTKATT